MAPSTVEAAQRHIGLLLEQVRLLHRQRQECERRLAMLLTREELAAVSSDAGSRREHSDLDILLSLPGAGNLVVATMLAEAGEALAARDYTTLRTRSSVAPVTRRSGKKLTVLMRYACNERLRNACHYWAQGAIRWAPHSQEHYAPPAGQGVGPCVAWQIVCRRCSSPCFVTTPSSIPHAMTPTVSTPRPESVSKNRAAPRPATG